ncbi:MAG TPA: hypothetical protein EYQ42_11590 [Thiotrichaceae bacterium]|nr:hypothetical protein [Thiotrichaceae bacterium]HIM08204.1 hypothetical protein [Gammaproteobacteria bacterium]
MIEMNSSYRICICLFLLFMSVINPVQSEEKINQAFSKFLSKCTTESDYDPNNTKISDKYTLAKGERAFLDCAYTGIEKNIIPESYIPNQYKDLIKSHRKWTNEVEKKLLTRSERRSRTLIVIGRLEKLDSQQKDLMIEQMQRTREVMMEDIRKRELHRLMQPRINYNSMRGALR